MIAIGGTFAFTVITLYCTYLDIKTDDVKFVNITNVYLLWALFVDSFVVSAIAVSNYVFYVVSLYYISIYYVNNVKFNKIRILLFNRFICFAIGYSNRCTNS